jgi:hypothetical protein
MKNLLKKLWEKIKAWAIKTALPWLKKEWMQIVNLIVLFIVYSNTDSLLGVQTITGLWIFVLLAYYIFWKFLGAEKIFRKKANTSVKTKK